MTVDLVITKAKLVIPRQGIVEADIAIKGEKIAQIAIPGTLSGPNVLDAGGKYIFPGCVDPHTHYGHFNEFYSDMESESRNAALTGITTSVILLDRNISNMEGWKERREDPELFDKAPGLPHALWKASYKKLFPEVIERAQKRSTNEFAFHLLMENLDQVNEIPLYYEELGISSFKFWTGREPPASLDHAEIWVLLRKCKEIGVLPYANCLNRRIWDRAGLDAEEKGKGGALLSGPKALRDSRPSFAETLDLQSVLYLARQVGSPELLIAHVTHRDSVELIRHYRSTYGLNVEGEGCAGWMSLWWPEVGERLGYAASGVIPQLGYKEDADSLWEGLSTGDISCIGTDGMVSPREKFPDGSPNPLYTPPPTKEKPGLGFPQHNCMFPVVLHMALERGLSPVLIAEACSYNPARILRLLPRKGTIAVGSDADLVIMDIGTPHRVRNSELYTAAPFSPWEGWELRCWPTLTMIRGRVIFENGRLVKENSGGYLPRYQAQ